MKYIGQNDYDHDNNPAGKQKVGVLITNLGTPDAPTSSALRRYLGEFLADPRVVEVPRLLWWFILHGVILRIRPSRSAKSYASIWTEQGSPLLIHTQDQAKALSAKLEQQYGDRVVVDFAMRYGNPSIKEKLQALADQDVRRLLVLPLYPQYSGATSASTFDAIAEDYKQRRWLPDFRFISHYHDHPAYIKALCDSITTYWEQNAKPEKLIFSYHGEPQRYLDEGDPYHCECLKTSRLVAEQLGLSKDDYLSSFQSRFGREAWLKPYTDETLKSLAADGVKNVQVICPGFSADCLETIEEIEIENRGYFMEAGGKQFDYIPCLNSDPGHIDMMATIINEQLAGWV